MENSQNMDNLTKEAFEIIRNWNKLTILGKFKKVSPSPSGLDHRLVNIYLDKKSEIQKNGK